MDVRLDIMQRAVCVCVQLISNAAVSYFQSALHSGMVKLGHQCALVLLDMESHARESQGSDRVAVIPGLPFGKLATASPTISVSGKNLRQTGTQAQQRATSRPLSCSRNNERQGSF